MPPYPLSHMLRDLLTVLRVAIPNPYVLAFVSILTVGLVGFSIYRLVTGLKARWVARKARKQQKRLLAWMQRYYAPSHKDIVIVVETGLKCVVLEITDFDEELETVPLKLKLQALELGDHVFEIAASKVRPYLPSDVKEGSDYGSSPLTPLMDMLVHLDSATRDSIVAQLTKAKPE